MNNKNILLAGLVVVLLGIGWFVWKPSVVITEQPKKVGAQTEISSNEFTIGGVRMFYYHQDFKDATTTPCSFPFPGATSTIISATVQATSATSGRIAWTMATSTSPYGTTSPLNHILVEPNRMFSMDLVGTSTATTSRLVATSTNLVIGANAQTGGHNPVSLTGTCNLILQAL